MIKEQLLRVVDRYLNKALDFRVRLFHVLAMAGTLISLAMAIAGLAMGTGISNVLTNLVTVALSYGLLRYSQRTGRYQICYTITICGIFLVLFPILFFSSGGYRGGMPSFFVFAVVFTIFMLDGKRAVFFSLLEVIVYVGLCLIAYFLPHTVIWFSEESGVLADVIVSFTAVSAALGVALYLHFRIYAQQQQKLTRQNEELDRVNLQKTEFLSNISHELKTPLTVLSSQIQLGRQNVESDGSPEETLRIMQLIGGEVERMAMMVGQLLDVGRIDEGRMPVEPKRESMVEIIQITLNQYYPVFTKNHNRLIFRKEGEIPPVRCDRLRIAQVLVNLINNASRHTREGELSVAVARQRDEVLVSVCDTGEGIAPERLPHLFARYSSHRRPATGEGRTAADTGTGLGLFICKYLVEAHGGRIWIESEPGRGTQAYFTLPVDL